MTRYANKTFEQKLDNYYSIQLHHAWILSNRHYIYIPEEITLFNDYKKYITNFNELDKVLKDHLKCLFSTFYDRDSLGLLEKENISQEILEYELSGKLCSFRNDVENIIEQHKKFISTSLTDFFKDYILKVSIDLGETITPFPHDYYNFTLR